MDSNEVEKITPLIAPAILFILAPGIIFLIGYALVQDYFETGLDFRAYDKFSVVTIVALLPFTVFIWRVSFLYCRKKFGWFSGR